MCWFGALLAIMSFGARDKQRQETFCDARAVELTGDPEALVSGLIKLYAAARLPRRIAAPQERAASHPSLSRRIRDIRRIAGVQPTALSEAVTIYGCDGSTVVSFEKPRPDVAAGCGRHAGDRLPASARASPRYRQTRRPAPPRGVRSATARGKSESRRMDVPRLQAVLDSVDGPTWRCACASWPVAVVQPRASSPVLSLLALATRPADGRASSSFVASLRPARALVGGAAAAAFGAGLLVVRDGPLTSGAADGGFAR